MRACPQPIVAAIDGICVGAGASSLWHPTFGSGTSRSKIAFLFTRVGLAGCDMGACAMLPRVIGQGRASELLYTGRNMGGEEAERWGFLNRICAPETLLPDAQALAAELASGPTFAHAMTKKMLHEEWNMGSRRGDRRRSAGAGDLHGDARFSSRLSRVRRQTEAGIQGRLSVPPFTHLDWPFFEPRHKALGADLDRWAHRHLTARSRAATSTPRAASSCGNSATADG